MLLNFIVLWLILSEVFKKLSLILKRPIINIHIEKMLEEIFKYLGITLVSSGAAYLIIKFFSQRIFENYLQQKLETHKSELEKLNISYQIQFSALHVERAEVIKSIYNILHDYKVAIMDFFAANLNEQNPKEHLNLLLSQWAKYAVNFNSTFHKNKIFFTQSQVDLLNNIDKKMTGINTGTQLFLSKYDLVTEQISAIKNQVPEFIELKKESIQIIEQEMLIEKELESEFRSLLGVELKQ